MTKKQSAFSKYAIGFALLYFAYSLAFNCYSALQFFNELNRAAIRTESHYLRLADLLLQSGKTNEVNDIFDEAVRENQLHFYLIRIGGVDYAYGNKYGDSIAFPKDLPEGVVETGEYRFSIIHEGKFEVIVGHQSTPIMTAKLYFREAKWDLAKDFLFVFGFVIGWLLYTFRDLRALVRKFSEKGARRGDTQIAKSKETLTLVRGLGGYEQHAEKLTRENELFKGQVLPALRKELQSGKKPPYEFECALVRMDINNFTSVFASDKRQHFMAAINEFFVGVTRIASRYNGHVYEFIGDEVLFYFKDDEHENSTAIALAALRDVNRLALELSERTEQEAGYQFRVKSSVAWGTLRFGPLVDGFALAGPTLIETVRMLSHIHEKSENMILLDQSLAERVADLARTQPHQVVMLKGLAGARHLHRVEAFTPVSLHLRQSTPEALEKAQYYRHDDDIVEILNYVEFSLGKVSDGILNKILGFFKTYRTYETSPALRRSYLNLLRALVGRAENAGSDEAQYLLASILSAASSFFTTKEWSGELRETFLKCLRLSNKRVVANALDVFAEIEPEAAEEIFNELAGFKDNRIAANALIKEGKRLWDKGCAKKLESMLDTKSPFFKASGLYALGEIAAHLKNTDAAVYSADSRLQALLSQSCGLAFHANAMVRRQALRVIAKSELQESLSIAFEKASTTNLPQDVLIEVRRFLNGDHTSNVVSLADRRSA